MLTRSSTNSDLPHKSLRITTHNQYPKEHKLLPKRLMINIRDHDHDHYHHHHDHQDHYHGGSSVSIPFMWESQPGTPKVVKFRETSLPPLTPPPSYCYSPVTKRPSQPNHHTKANNYNPVKAIFPKKKRFPSTGSSSSSSPSSLSPSPSSSTNSDYSPLGPAPPSPANTPSKSRGPRRRPVSSPRVSVDSRANYEEERGGSPVSTLCFGRSGVNERAGSGCYSSLIKVLFS